MTGSKSKGFTMAAFLVLLACAAVLALASARYLPAVVASHFGASGHADGFMPRAPYVGVMLVVSVIAPLLVALIPLRAFRGPDPRIHLPNPEYWLADVRREATLAYLSGQALRFAAMLTVFLCYIQVLVVVANRAAPPQLPAHWFGAGLFVYGMLNLVWLIGFSRHFRKASRDTRGPEA